MSLKGRSVSRYGTSLKHQKEVKSRSLVRIKLLTESDSIGE